MSLLAKAVRSYLAGQVDFATQFPGGIHPDVAPAGKPMTYGVTTAATSNRKRYLDGSVYGREETCVLIITDPDRTNCEAVADWVAGKLEVQGGWSAVASPTVKYWMVTNQSDAAEVLLDGTDESIRQVTLEVTGFIQTTS